MTCCGRQRMDFSSHGVGGSDKGGAVRLSYGGVQTILVRGTATGRIYRFAPGTWQSVHPADAPQMIAIPGLRPNVTTS